jgi:hypothetical protein
LWQIEGVVADSVEDEVLEFVDCPKKVISEGRHRVLSLWKAFYLVCVPSADIGSTFDVGARKLENRAKIAVSVGKSSAQVVFLSQPKADDKRPYDTRILCP